MDTIIKNALPNIDSSKVEAVIVQLKAVGVDCEDDLEFVEEKYLENVLRPIEIKKFLLKIRKQKEIPSEKVPSTNLAGLAKEAAPTLGNSHDLFHPSVPISIAKSDWAEKFEIPWNLFCKELITACEQKKNCSKRSMAEMIRLIASQVSKYDEAPGRKNIRIIAQKIVSKYPDTFEDRCGDSVVAGGFTTLMRKIENCLDNKKRIHSVQEKFDGLKKKKTTRDSYGTVNWQPKDLPDGETKISQLQHKQWLMEEFSKVDRDDEKIISLMEITYATQRFFINGHKSAINAVKREWPFLFEESQLLKHCHLLLNEDINKNFMGSVSSQTHQIYEFMKTKSSNKAIFEVLKEIEVAKAEAQNLTPEVIGAFPLLLAYFNEPIETIFKSNLDPVCDDDLEKNESCLTPFVATTCGNIYNSSEYILMIDGVAVMHLTSFMSSVKAMFAAYYVFNIEYPQNGHLTLEFMQRCLFHINPKRGSKAPRNKKAGIPAQIFKLVEELKNFNSLFQL